MIISIGYRVKSKNGVIFRKWATKVLKEHLLKGYSINQKRLDYLEKTVKLIDIAGRIDSKLENSDAREIIQVINNYSKALNLLDNYDYKKLTKPKRKRYINRLSNEFLNKLKSSLFFIENFYINYFFLFSYIQLHYLHQSLKFLLL